VFVAGRKPRYSENEARAAVAAASSYADALRRLGMRPAGGNHRTLRRYVDEIWSISTSHFDPDRARNEALKRGPIPLSDVLVETSTYSRGHLKARLFKEGLKARRCELCGQDEMWQRKRMSLILDHINGVADDHRLGNLSSERSPRSAMSARVNATGYPITLSASGCGNTSANTRVRSPHGEVPSLE
jgi:hypothetical protein